MSRRCYCSLSIFCVLILASHALAQNPSNVPNPSDVVAVTGTIFSEDGQRLDNAMVNLCDPSGNLIQQGASGGGGYFAFRELR
jgi:hypothetical protein